MNRLLLLFGTVICVALAGGCERSDVLKIDKTPGGMVTTVTDQSCDCSLDGEILQQHTKSAIGIKKTDDGKLVIDANVFSDKELECFPVGSNHWRIRTSPFSFSGDNYTVMFNDQVSVTVTSESLGDPGMSKELTAGITGYITHLAKYYTKSDESYLQFVITIAWTHEGLRHELALLDGLRYRAQ